MSPALAGQFFTTNTTREAQGLMYHNKIPKLALCFVQLLSHVRLFVIPWIAAHQASLSFTVSQSLLKLLSIQSLLKLLSIQSLLKLLSIQSVMPSNHLILCRLLLLLPSIFPSIRVFSNESALSIRWPKD